MTEMANCWEETVSAPGMLPMKGRCLGVSGRRLQALAELQALEKLIGRSVRGLVGTQMSSGDSEP